MLANERLKLSLIGPFRLQNQAGGRIEISSKKAVAVLAMLAMAPNGERTRSWLQDKLWGSRRQQQGRSSLRRELSTLRGTVNAHLSAISADRDRIHLNLALVEVDARADAEVVSERLDANDFLEGLDVSEEGFEDWLREQRSKLRSKGRRPETEKPVIEAPKEAAHSIARIVDLTQPAPGFGGRPALAVLQFENATGDPANAYLAEGMGEELIDRLSRLRWLPVIAPSSSFRLDAKGMSLSEVGRNLGARYILEGRLRRLADSHRLAVTLSDAETGQVLHSQPIDTENALSNEALDRMVPALVGVLDTRIDHAEQARARARPVDRQDVNQLVWRGRWHLNRFTRADSAIARDLLDQALALDPDSPEALIQATFCMSQDLWSQRASEAEILPMRRLAQRAIVADPSDARAHMLAGMAEMWLGHHTTARALFLHALALNPSLAHAHGQLGSSYYLTGSPAEALAPLQTYLRLSPMGMHIFYPLGELGVAASMLGDFAAAIVYADQAIGLRRAYWYAHVVKTNALARTGEMAKARAALNELMLTNPKFDITFIDWLPFTDPSWREFFAGGLRLASQ